MTCRERLETYLRENSVAYEVHHHPAALTAQEVAQGEHIPGRMLAKVVMARSDGGLVMVALPAPARLDLGRLGEALGRDVRLAGEAEFAPAFPDCDAGAMPAFGNLYGLEVLVDRGLAAERRIAMQAGTHTDCVIVPWDDFDRLVHPRIADVATVP